MKNKVKVSSYADAVERQFDNELQPKVRLNARKRRKLKGAMKKKSKGSPRIKLRMKHAE